MGNTTVTSNLFYDLVSIQYHALKGQEVYSKFIKDAQGDQDIVRFFEQVRDEDIRRAEQCHEFLTRISTGGGGTAEPYPSDGASTDQRQTTGSGTR